MWLFITIANIIKFELVISEIMITFVKVLKISIVPIIQYLTYTLTLIWRHTLVVHNNKTSMLFFVVQYYDVNKHFSTQ